MYELIFAIFVYVLFGLMFANMCPIDWKDWKNSKLRWKIMVTFFIAIYPLVIIAAVLYTAWNAITK